MNNLMLLEKAKTNQESLEEIVESNKGLVWSMVKRFQNRGYESEDLFQIGCIGLIKAIKKFDFNFNVKISTYAVPFIIGEIKMFLRDNGIIKISRVIKETANKIITLKEFMQKELGRDPTIKELSLKLNISEDEIIIALDSTNEPKSLYDTVNDKGNETFLIDKITDTQTKNLESQVIDKLVLRDILKSLDIKSKKIIFLRYFKEKSQTQTAKILGISQVQISRIEKRTLENIKKKFLV